MEQKRILRVVVASPSDVQAERDLLPGVLDELNRSVAAERGLLLELHRWETDAYPGFHPEGPQGLIDPVLKVEDCDILIGIFWKRFGTPTAEAGSGTEHEINRAYAAWEKNRRPQIMVYFNQKEYAPRSKEETDQWGLVFDFQQRIPGKGLWWHYKGPAQFEKLVRNHLGNFIRENFPVGPADPSAALGPPGRRLNELTADYRAHLTQQISTVRLLSEAELQPLEKVFVDLNITEEYERPKIQAALLSMLDIEFRRQRGLLVDLEERRDEAGQDVQESGKARRTIKPDELLQGPTRALITGAPGCGKTTLVKYLALNVLRENRRLPVLLELKAINRELFKQVREDLAELLFEKSLAEPLQLKEEEERRLAREFFFDVLKKGEAVIFLDGLDEVRGEEFFPGLCKSVNAFMRSVYRYNDLVITTRPYALVTRFEGLTEMEIAPLSLEQIRAFLEHYYANPVLVAKLTGHIGRYRELHELARVPFLLGVIAELYRSQGQVVGDRLRLYRQIIKRLVVLLDREKSVERFYVEDPTGVHKLELLKHLAYERLFVDPVTQDIERLVFTDDEILKKAHACCRPGVNPDYLTADVIATPLLREVGDNTYAFAHLTLQEYLAAEKLSEQEDRARIFCERVFNPVVVSMEVLPMALGFVPDPEDFYELLERLPESITFTVLRLRARGLAYVRRIDPEHLKSLVARVLAFQTRSRRQQHPHIDTILRSFSAAAGQPAAMIVRQVAFFLRDDAAQTRLDAASVLGEIGSTLALDELFRALWDKEYAVRAAAADALGKIGDERALGELQTALDSLLPEDAEDAPRRVVYDLRAGQGQSPTEDEDLSVTVKAVGSFRASLINAIKTIRTTTIVIEVRRAARGEAGEAAAGAPVGPESIHTPSGSLSEFSAGGGTEGDENDIHVLLSCLQDKRFGVRHEAAKRLSELGDRRAVEGLIAVLRDDFIAVREAAAQALEKIGDRRAVEGLLEVLCSKRPGVRLVAAKAIKKIADRRAVEGLLGPYATKTSASAWWPPTRSGRSATRTPWTDCWRHSPTSTKPCARTRRARRGNFVTSVPCAAC